MSKAEEAQRYAIIGMLADAGKLDKVKAISERITAVVNEAEKEEEGIGTAALALAALDAAIVQDT